MVDNNIMDANNLQMFAAMQQKNDPIMLKLLQQMADMQSAITNMTLTYKAQKPNAPLSDSINPKTGKPWRRYCWTHGCCTHWSKNCPQKKSGHKDDATFRNRMGGSNEKCL